MKKMPDHGVQKRVDIEIVQSYLKKDYLKEVLDTLYDLPEKQHPRKHYLSCIEHRFRHSTKGGSGYTISLII